MAFLDDVCDALSCGRPGCDCQKLRGGKLMTHCPAHEDRHTSLSVTESGDKPLVHCHAGCGQDAVLAALRSRGVWPDAPDRSAKKPERVSPVSKSPATSKSSAGPKSPATSKSGRAARVVAAYDYTDENGALLYQSVRMEPKKFFQRRPDPDAPPGDGGRPGGWINSLGTARRVLYRLPEVLAAAAASHIIYVVEGEKDADALAALGLCATTAPMGAGKWDDAYAEALRGADVVILPDNDAPGRAHAADIARSLQGRAARIRTLTLPGLPDKGDVSDWLAAGGTASELAASELAAFIAEDEGPMPALQDEGRGGPSDLTLATAWARSVDGRWLYVEGDQWWRYEDGLWSYSSLEAVQADVQRFLTALREGTPRTPGNDKLTVTRSRIQGVVFLGKSLLGPVPLTEFDTRPEWIPLRNGVFDTRAGSLIVHAPDHRLTRRAAYEYDPCARCPRWEKFLLEVMLTPDGFANSEWIGILQEWFGYCLISDTTAQTAMFWVGDGQNGKGTATRVLEQLVGADACTAIPIEQLHDPYYRAALYGKMVGLVNEPDPKAMQKNGTFFKALTGGDRIDARRPTEKVFSFFPTCRLVISCNDLPSTRDVSRGYFRRIILIEWRYNVPSGVRDARLDDVLRAELPGIFNWAIGGLRRWEARGRAFEVPQESADLLTEYRMGEDTVGRFLEERTVRGDAGFAACGAIYAAYARWCRESGERAESAALLGRRLKKAGLRQSLKRLGGHVMRGWDGLSLVEPNEE